MSRPRLSPVEAGQLLSVLVAFVGLFVILPVGWALLVSGVIGAALLTLVERAAPGAARPAEPTPETEGA